MIAITVAYAAPDRQMEIPLIVEENCTIALAVRRSGLLQAFPEIQLSRATVGVYGKRVLWDDLVRAGYRIEVYRPLQIDPKQARLEKVNEHRWCNG